MLRQLAGQTAIYGISSIVSRLLNYLLTPFLTRIMTTGEYGVITDMYALIPFAMVVLTMGIYVIYGVRSSGHRFSLRSADHAAGGRSPITPLPDGYAR